MAQHVIDVDGVPTLFSPVPAHSLEPGDLVAHPRVPIPGAVFRLTEASATRFGTMRLRAVGQQHAREIPVNRPLLRAVGARAGRGGAR